MRVRDEAELQERTVRELAIRPWHWQGSAEFDSSRNLETRQILHQLDSALKLPSSDARMIISGSISVYEVELVMRQQKYTRDY